MYKGPVLGPLYLLPVRRQYGQGRAMRRSLKAKARQAAKLAEIRESLIAAGYDTTAKQAAALGVSRPPAWVLLNRHKRVGPSAHVIKRILLSPDLPSVARRKVEEYVEERIAGVYGHTRIEFGGFAIRLPWVLRGTNRVNVCFPFR